MGADCVAGFEGGGEAGGDDGAAEGGVGGAPLEGVGVHAVLVGVGWMRWLMVSTRVRGSRMWPKCATPHGEVHAEVNRV